MSKKTKPTFVTSRLPQIPQVKNMRLPIVAKTSPAVKLAVGASLFSSFIALAVVAAGVAYKFKDRLPFFNEAAKDFHETKAEKVVEKVEDAAVKAVNDTKRQIKKEVKKEDAAE